MYNALPILTKLTGCWNAHLVRDQAPQTLDLATALVDQDNSGVKQNVLTVRRAQQVRLVQDSVSSVN